MSEPRLSRRESSTGLRRDTLASQNRKRSGSNASTTSRPSMLAPKGLGLTRKASTATLSVAPVAASANVDHSLGTGTEAARTDQVRPTRAQDALRFVQARAPVAPAALAPEEVGSPKTVPAPLESIPDDAPAPSTSPSRIPRPKSRASLIPTFRGSPERTKTLPGNAASSVSADKSSPTPKRTSTTSPPTSKFRSPGLARKPSTSSIRSFKPASASPLATVTTTTAALPKLDTASVSVQPPKLDGVNASPSSTSWLSSIRAITSTKSAVAQDSPQILVSESPTAQTEPDAAEKKPTTGLSVSTAQSNLLAISPVSTSKSKSSTGTPTQSGFTTAPVSPVDSDNGLVLVDSASPIQASANGNGYRINELAAQHASNAAWSAINAPASWLAWMTAGSGSSLEGNNGGAGSGGAEVMDIEWDEEEGGKGKGKGKEVERPPHVTALSVDSVVPPLPEGNPDARDIHMRHTSMCQSLKEQFESVEEYGRVDIEVGAGLAARGLREHVHCGCVELSTRKATTFARTLINSPHDLSLDIPSIQP